MDILENADFIGAMEHGQLAETFSRVDLEIGALESRLAGGRELPLRETVERAMDLVKALMIAFIRDEGRKLPPDPGVDLLEAWKVLVKGDPTWNTIRDNCRELVYYRNCLDMNRADALPQVSEKMAVRTLRHIYLYMKTRCIRDGKFEG